MSDILIFSDFQFSRDIPGPTVSISHFSRVSAISSFFDSSSGCFSFSMIFSFPAIFHVLQWTFLNFPTFSVFHAIFHVLKCVFLIIRDFQFSPYIPGPTVCISHFPPFSVFLEIFQVLQCVFLIFYEFQYSRHTPGLQYEFIFFHVFQGFTTYFTS